MFSYKHPTSSPYSKPQIVEAFLRKSAYCFKTNYDKRKMADLTFIIPFAPHPASLLLASQHGLFVFGINPSFNLMNNDRLNLAIGFPTGRLIVIFTL